MHQNVNTSELEEVKLLEVTDSSHFLMYSFWFYTRIIYPIYKYAVGRGMERQTNIDERWISCLLPTPEWN